MVPDGQKVHEMRSRKPFSKIRVCIHFPLNLYFFREEQKPLEEKFQEEHCPCWKPWPFGLGLPSTCSMAEQPWGEKRFNSPHGVVVGHKALAQSA